MEINALWVDYIEAQKRIDICLFKIRKLPIDEQIEILDFAFKQGNEREALLYIHKVEPVGFKNSERELSKALLDMIISIATHPSNYEIEAMDLLIELSVNFEEYRDIIYNQTMPYLNEADKDSDYEVYQRVYDLLQSMESKKIQEFISRCKNHSSEEIKAIVEE
ncbi:MAG: hypothetical protein ACFB0B_15635 [Thermonemataceae bacterium]